MERVMYGPARRRAAKWAHRGILWVSASFDDRRHMDAFSRREHHAIVDYCVVNVNLDMFEVVLSDYMERADEFKRRAGFD